MKKDKYQFLEWMGNVDERMVEQSCQPWQKEKKGRGISFRKAAACMVFVMSVGAVGIFHQQVEAAIHHFTTGIAAMLGVAEDLTPYTEAIHTSQTKEGVTVMLEEVILAENQLYAAFHMEWEQDVAFGEGMVSPDLGIGQNPNINGQKIMPISSSVECYNEDEGTKGHQEIITTTDIPLESYYGEDMGNDIATDIPLESHYGEDMGEDSGEDSDALVKGGAFGEFCEGEVGFYKESGGFYEEGEDSYDKGAGSYNKSAEDAGVDLDALTDAEIPSVEDGTGEMGGCHDFLVCYMYEDGSLPDEIREIEIEVRAYLTMDRGGEGIPFKYHFSVSKEDLQRDTYCVPIDVEVEASDGAVFQFTEMQSNKVFSRINGKVNHAFFQKMGEREYMLQGVDGEGNLLKYEMVGGNDGNIVFENEGKLPSPESEWIELQLYEAKLEAIEWQVKGTDGLSMEQEGKDGEAYNLNDLDYLPVGKKIRIDLQL